MIQEKQMKSELLSKVVLARRAYEERAAFFGDNNLCSSTSGSRCRLLSGPGKIGGFAVNNTVAVVRVRLSFRSFGHLIFIKLTGCSSHCKLCCWCDHLETGGEVY